MARAKLITNLEASAKKTSTPKKKKINDEEVDDELDSDLMSGSIFDDSEDPQNESDEDIQIEGEAGTVEEEDMPANLSEEDSEGGGPYTMGDITYEGDDSEDKTQPIEDTSKQSEDDDDVVWVDDEVSMEDKDPWQDMEDFDIDNPESDEYD